MGFTPYRLYHKPPLRGGNFLAALSPSKSSPCRARRARVASRSRGVCEVKEEDGVPYTIQAHEQMVVKVGLGTFELKGAE